MKYVLETEDYQSLLLFAYIESSRTHVVSIKTIEAEFDLTYFKANRLMSNLIHDLEKLELDQYFYIEKENGEYLYKKNGLDSINRLLWMYSRRSLRFNLIDYLLKNPEATIEEFSSEAYISLTKAYKVRKSVRDFFKQYHLKGFETKTAQEELRLRLVITQLYYHAFKDYETPFQPLEVQRADYIVELLENKQVVNIQSDAQRIFLKFYCLVSAVRSRQGYQFKVAPNWQHKVTQYQAIIVQAQAEFPQGMIGINENEIAYLLQMLDILHWENDSQQATYAVPQVFKEQVGRILQTSFEQYSQLSELDLINNPILEKLWVLCQKYYYDDNIVIDGFFYTNLGVFEENYYELYQACETFIAELEKRKLLRNIQNHKTFVMEMVMLALNNLDFETFIPSVVITINFSLGKAYNDFIEANLRALPFANIQINNQYSEQTDIYLADVLSRKIESEYIIWNSPPNAADWEIFGNLVARIKGEKR